jgi:hypothetical protein
MLRGFRNCNPGNIRPGQHFHGEVGVDEGNYSIFVNPHFGIRAIAVDLRTKIRHGLNTVAKIIFKYAPPSENDTVAYVKAVCHDIGFKSDTVIDADDEPTLCKFVRAIIVHENGSCPYADADIAAAVEDALGVHA